MNHQPTQNEENVKEQLERAQRELSVLYNINSAMRTTLELNHILYIILTGVTSHTGLGFNRALLFLANKTTRHLEAKMTIGPESGEDAERIWKYIEESEPEMEDLIRKDKISYIATSSKLYKTIRDLKFPLDPQGDYLLTKAYYKGSPWLLRRAELEEYRNDPLLKVFQTSELAIVPLKAQDTVNGLIIADNLYTQKPITDDDLKIFVMVASQAGLAIENSRLYELVVQKSFKDSLTDLWNHGYFQNTLLEEIKKAMNKNTPLSLLMIDIDNFKSLNDTYGHQNGDTVLRDLAELLRNSSREIDCVCRYGGEEFSMILTQTDKGQAYTIAERIREKIANYKFQNFKPNQQLQITVSIGLASFPMDAGTPEELIEKADKSMYVAKLGGKNQTCVHENSY
ncbi:MAG: sensor domain-containing diguanylate cyclase [Candidatus Omnitrophota bacterium]